VLLDNAIQDVRYALRQLRKSPGFTALAVITLALGIAATSTIFTWINSTLLNPVPGVSRTSDMITIQRGERSEHPSPPFSYGDFVDLREGTHSLSGFLGYHDEYMSITGSANPERIYGALASANYFEVLGVHPVLGRALAPSAANERLGEPEAVLSYELWQNQFAGDPSIVGKTIQINLHPLTIVGVAPKGFRGCKTGLRTDIWIPLGMDRQINDDDRIDYRGVSWLNVLGVLRPGVDRHQAENELNVLMQHIVDRYPAEHQGNDKLSADPLWRTPFGANVYFAGTLPMLLALAAALLLLACANVANLLLVRSITRRRELAIRLSMGASRWRVVRQLLIENLAIATLAGGAAFALTYWTAGTLSDFVPQSTLPLAIAHRVDANVLLATMLISFLTAAISGIFPALRASGLSPITVLKDESLSVSGGVQKSRLSSALVIVQISLSVLLLASAGLFVRSLENAQRSDPGFDSDHVLLMSFNLQPLGYSEAAGKEFQRRVIENVKQLPGVESAALADFSPLSFTIGSEGALPEGYVRRVHESIEADRGIVSAGYLKTLRTPLLEGREFTAQDTDATQPVAVVNRAFVERYWQGTDPIGKRIRVGNGWYTVVGVAANGKYRRLTDDPAPMVFTPLMQRYQDEVILHVRVSGEPLSYASAVKQAIHGLNSGMPLYNVSSMQESMQMGSVFERVAVVFASAFGLLALILAAVGIYGVVSYTTRQRTHEIGIRMALGAQRADVFRQVLRQGARLTLTGLLVGLAVSLFLTRFLRGMLYGVGTADWLTFATVAAILCFVALTACFVPARRAASVEPMQALRTE
jgi:predicted permease